ncbi:hypothetical protein [Streptosporangium sp. NPDC051022]|uniref:hypothetical protein n=1 Tax=Streptosporangium sp. NPDC051022 TaxID=3155752 RepID=UPI00342FC560
MEDMKRATVAAGTNNADSNGTGPGSGLVPRITRRGNGWRVGAVLLALGVLGAGFLYVNRDDSPEAPPAWKPGPFDPPVQYAFVPQASDCHDRFDAEDENTTPNMVTCSEWQLRVNHKKGGGRQDLDTAGVSCGGVEIGDDDCSSDIPLSDAASQIRLEGSRRKSAPLRITPDGHHLAYFSRQHMRFVGWDLPTAQLKAISPRLDARAFGDVSGVEISPDGRFFAVAFSGARPRLLLTDFVTGQTSAFPGLCNVQGLSESAAVIAARRTCPEDGENDPASNTVTILDHKGAVTGEWRGGDFMGGLSPDGRLLVEILADVGGNGKEYLVTYDAETGKTVNKLELRLLSEPSDAVGYGWLNADEYIVEAKSPEPGGSFGYYQVDVRTGKSQRIRDLGLNPGAKVFLGKVHIDR